MKVMTTRSRPRSSTVSYSSNPRRTREVYARLQARLPRRMSDEDARERYRREKFGQLGPVDAWLLARLSQNRTQSQNQGRSQSLTLESQSASASILPRLGPRQGGEASADEVRCTVQVECIEAPSDGSGFDDPDKYILYLTTTTAGAARRLGAEGNDAPSTSKFNLGEFVGEPENVEAPEWMRQYHTGQPKEFWASAAAVADVLQHTAPWEGVLGPLLESLGAVSLDE